MDDTGRIAIDCSSSGPLLERFMRARCLPAHDVRRIRDRGELPGKLQAIIDHGAGLMEWRAFSDERQLWFAMAPIIKARDSAGRPILDIYLHAESGEAISAGRWLWSGDGWQMISELP